LGPRALWALGAGAPGAPKGLFSPFGPQSPLDPPRSPLDPPKEPLDPQEPPRPPKGAPRPPQRSP